MFSFFILLVILGGISITALTGENGLFGRAKSAGDYCDVESAVSLGAVGTITGNGKIVWNGQATPPTSQTTYTVSFKDGETTLSTQTVNEGATVTRPTDPTKAGNTFAGWFSNSALTTEYDFTSTITGDTTIYAKWELAQQTWSHTADGVHVTDGNITLEVGSQVTGYSVTVDGTIYGDGNWYVLGAEDGKLLITTTANVGSTIQLSGQDGYVNGISTLNTVASAYRNLDYADEARSINVDDINRVTLYNPDTAQCNNGQVYGYGNKVTYTLNSSDSKIHYQGATSSYLPARDKTSSYNSFTYWNGSSWVSLSSGESATLDCTRYYYFPQTLSTTSSSDTSFNGSSAAYALLFQNGSGLNEKYWLGSQYTYTYAALAYFGFRYVDNGYVNGNNLCDSNGNYGLRPAIVLSSNVNVSSSGAISK